MRALRNVLRRGAARALGFALRLSGRRAGLVLVYHDLAERTGNPARELVPPHSVSLFEAQIRHVISRYRVVPAVRLQSAASERMRGRRFPVAITFDDDLVSHLRLAAPVLRHLGVSATFFLTGASLERPSPFWWQRLQAAVDRGLDTGEEGIHELASRLEGMRADERAAVVAPLEEGVPEPGLRGAEVRALAEGGFDVGFHTLRHECLTHLDDGALREALVDGRAALEAASGRTLDAVAYPHGKADERVARAARSAGFQVGFTGRYEPVEPSTSPLLLGRIEPTFGELTDFAVQLVGALRKRSHR